MSIIEDPRIATAAIASRSAIANPNRQSIPLRPPQSAILQKVALAIEPFSPAAHTVRVPRTTDSVWKPGPLNGDHVRPPSLEESEPVGPTATTTSLAPPVAATYPTAERNPPSPFTTVHVTAAVRGDGGIVDRRALRLVVAADDDAAIAAGEGNREEACRRPGRNWSGRRAPGAPVVDGPDDARLAGRNPDAVAGDRDVGAAGGERPFALQRRRQPLADPAPASRRRRRS